MSASPTSLPSEEEVRAIFEENAVLKTLLADFKEELNRSSSELSELPPTRAHLPGFVEKYDKTSASAKAGRRGGGSSSPQRSSPQRQQSAVYGAAPTAGVVISSISHPAILWKELQAEQKRSTAYRREVEYWREKCVAASEVDLIEKMRHKMQQLTERVVSLTEENRALTSIQLHQEKQLVSEELLEKHWPVQMEVLKQDLHAAKEAGLREQKKASELRKKGLQKESELLALKETNKFLKSIQPPSFDPTEPIISEKELRRVETLLMESKVRRGGEGRERD